MVNNPIQCLNLQHRTLVGLLVVGVQPVLITYQHRPVTGTYPREVELREYLYDSAKYLRADIAFTVGSVVRYVLCRQAALPFKVDFCNEEALRLSPSREFAKVKIRINSLFFV